MNPFHQSAAFSSSSLSTSLGRWIRVFFVLASLVFLGSCSTARLGYSNADTLVYWWLDGYVDFHSSQKTKVKRDIDQLLSWHRSTQLPQYVQVLTQMQTNLAANPGPAEVEALFRQVETLSQAILLRAVPEVTDFLLTMNESQRAHLARKFERNNQDYREKYLELKPEKQIKERRKKVMKQAEEWLGSVNREQELLIARYLEKNPPNYAQWLDDSVARQRMVLQLMMQIQIENPARDRAQTMVQTAITAAFAPADHSDRQTPAESSRAAIQQLVVSILRAATQEQKNHAREKLQAWIDDCKYLIARK